MSDAESSDEPKAESRVQTAVPKLTGKALWNAIEYERAYSSPKIRGPNLKTLLKNERGNKKLSFLRRNHKINDDFYFL